jgi:hypothetical protein
LRPRRVDGAARPAQAVIAAQYSRAQVVSRPIDFLPDLAHMPGPSLPVPHASDPAMTATNAGQAC